LDKKNINDQVLNGVVVVKELHKQLLIRALDFFEAHDNCASSTVRIFLISLVYFELCIVFGK